MFDLNFLLYSIFGFRQNDGSATFNITKYGTFTANFNVLPPPIPPQYWIPLYGIVFSTVVAWSIPSIFGWFKARTQRKHLKECINNIGKLDRNAMEDKIIGYYVDHLLPLLQ